MKRRILRCFAILLLVFAIGGRSALELESTPDGMDVTVNLDSITCETETIDSVTLLAEEVGVASNTDNVETASNGIASFQTDEKAYIFGHWINNEVGSPVFKVSRTGKEISIGSHIGNVISNEDKGVVMKSYLDVTEYPSIPIAKSIQKGEAFILKRDECGNIHKYPITILDIATLGEDNNKSISISMNDLETGELRTINTGHIIGYVSSEYDFGPGSSGAPIIQNDELIGVHFGNKYINNKNLGVAWVIWDLDIVNATKNSLKEW